MFTNNINVVCLLGCYIHKLKNKLKIKIWKITFTLDGKTALIIKDIYYCSSLWPINGYKENVCFLFYFAMTV